MAPGVFKGVAHNLFTTRSTYEFQALHHIVRFPVLDTSVEILLVLTNDDHGHRTMLVFDKWIIRDAGTHVCIQSKTHARRDVQAFIAAAFLTSNGCLNKYLGFA